MRGIGRLAAFAAFDMFRGLWEVNEIPSNARAIAFWRSVISEYTSGRFEETTYGEGDPCQVFDNRRQSGRPAS